MKYFYCLFLLPILMYWTMLSPTTANAQLSTGDIAIIGANSDVTPDELTIITLAPIPSGTTIYISDFYWDATNVRWGNDGNNGTTLSGADGIITWTTTSLIPAGTIYRIGIGIGPVITGLPGTVSATGWASTQAMATTGEGWFIYQGTNPQTPTTWIFGFYNALAAAVPANYSWQTSNASLASNLSMLPAGLTNGVNAISIAQNGGTSASNPSFDNNVYSTGGLRTGTKAQILSAICTPANWIGDEATAYDISPTSTYFTGANVFTITAACVTPTAYTVTGGGAYCGVTPVNVGLSDSETGVTYQLYLGASTVGSPVNGTGNAISFGGQTGTGTYTVVATRTTGGCTANMTGSVAISTATAPSTALATLTNVSCNGGSDGAIVLQSSPTGLSTPLTSNNSGGGISFDVTINNTVTITGFDLNLMNTPSRTVGFYYRTGTVAGNELNSAGWTLVDSALTISNGTNVASPFTLSTPLTLPAGNYGFYLVSWDDNTAANTALRYTNGTTAGSLWASNADMTIYEGTGRSTMSVGTEFSTPPTLPRRFSGTIKYGVSYAWSNGATSPNITALPVGNYTVIATNSGTGCTSTATYTITQPPALMPTFTVSPAASVCAGTSVTYATQSGQNNYVWSVPGASGTDYTITAGGIGTTSNTVTLTWLTSGAKTVTVNYTNASACTGAVAASAMLSVLTVPGAVLDASNTTRTANAECTDGSGWTHYYSTSANEIVLSIKKNGNDIGSIGAGLTVAAYTNGNWSAGTAASITPNSNYVTNDGWNAMNRWWDVTPANQPTTDVQVRSYYTQADLDGLKTATGDNALTHTQLRFYKINDPAVGGPYVVNPASGHSGIPAASIYSDPGYWEYINAASASTNTWAGGTVSGGFYAEYTVRKFSGGGGGGAPGGGGAFPVEWLDFTATPTASGSVVLGWATASEQNSATFRAERSANGLDYEEIGAVDAAGNSTEPRAYTLTDIAPHRGRNHYRIREVDMDGRSHLTQTVEVWVGENGLSLWPNPATETLHIHTGAMGARIRLYDMAGKQVLEYQCPENEMAAALSLDVLPAGVYQAEVIAGGTRTVQAVVRQ